MKRRMKKLLKKAAVLLSVVICIGCIGLKLAGITAEDGKRMLLFATGLGYEEDVSEAGLKEKKVVAEDTPTDGHQTIMMEDDGIVPFHQGELPSLSEEPDPNRASAPVEEISAQGGEAVGNFYVKDTTDSGTDLAQELLNDPSVNIQANGEVEVLLYHTHTTEAYMDKYTGFYYTDMETRSQNQDMGVVAVGEEIRKELEKAGIGVIHDKSINDTMFNGSYSRSWEVLQRNLEEYPTIQVTIDIHRDSMTTEEGVKYKPTSEIEGRKAAQIMLMTGCDAFGDWGDFPDWVHNLRLAMRVQQKVTEMYPDLMRPMSFSNSKYNMNATKGSLLIEVGTEVNTISEAKYSGKLMGKALAELLPELRAEAEAAAEAAAEAVEE